MTRLMAVLLAGVFLALPSQAQAQPACADLFTDPYRGYQGSLDTPVGNAKLQIKNGNSRTLYANQSPYYYDEILIDDDSKLLIDGQPGQTVTIFANKITMGEAAKANEGGDSSALLLVIHEKGDIKEDAEIYGFVWFDDEAVLKEGAKIHGGLGGGGKLDVEEDFQYHFEEDKWKEGDFSLLCDGSETEPPPPLGHLEQCVERYPGPISGMTTGVKLKGDDEPAFVYGTHNFWLNMGGDVSWDKADHWVCDGKECSAEGPLALDAEMPAFIDTDSNTKLEVKSGEVVVLTAADGVEYKEITIKSGGSLTFAADQRYLITTLEMEKASHLVMPAGNYYVNDFTTKAGKDESEEAVIEVTGTITVVVEDKFELGEYGRFNTPTRGEAGPSELVEFWGFDHLHINAGSVFSGYLYSSTEDGHLRVKKDATLYGAATIYKELELEGNAVVDGSQRCQSRIPEPTVYRVQHRGQAVQCEGGMVTLQACADLGCTKLMTTPTTVALNPSQGWDVDDASAFTFTGEATIRLRSNNLSERIQLGTDLAQSCLVNGLPSTDCEMTFVESGLVLESLVPQGCSTETLQVRAIQSADDPQVCVGALTGSQPLTFQLSAVAPSSPVGSPSFTLAGSSLPFDQSMDLTLDFDDQGVATPEFRYDDVGLLQLTAQHVAEDGLELYGSASLVMAPSRFVLTSEDPAGVCAAGDSSCTAFRRAGEAFSLQVQAQCGGDVDGVGSSPANNFEHSGIKVQPELVAPSDGRNGVASVDTVPISLGSQGVGRVTMSISEVGVFKWALDGAVDYHGRAISQQRNDALGRFIPSYLEAVPNSPSLSAFCASWDEASQPYDFTYLEQPLGFAVYPELVLRGRNRAGTQTYNYVGEFWRVADQQPLFSYHEARVGAANAQAFEFKRYENERRLDWENGEVRFSSVDLHARFAAQLSLSLSADDVTDLDDVCVQANADGGCLGVDFTGIGGTELVSGRMMLGNVFGSESQTLDLPVYAQAYDGRYFVTHRADQCTTIDPDQLELANDEISPSPGQAMTDGRATVVLSGTGQALETEVEYLLGYPHWLQWFWMRQPDQDDVNRQCQLPSGEGMRCNPKSLATFGRFRGHDKVIYRREIPPL